MPRLFNIIVYLKLFNITNDFVTGNLDSGIYDDEKVDSVLCVHYTETL